MQLIKIVSSFIFFSMFSLNINAQNRESQIRTEFNNLKNLLKMDDKNFREFKHNLALFNDSITQTMNNRGLTAEDRKKKVELIQFNRKAHLRKTLSREQYLTFAEFEKNIQQSLPQRKRLEGKKL